MVQKPFTSYIVHFTLYYILYTVLYQAHRMCERSFCDDGAFSYVCLHSVCVCYAFKYFHILLIAMLLLPHAIPSQLNGWGYTLLSILECPRVICTFFWAQQQQFSYTYPQNSNNKIATKWKLNHQLNEEFMVFHCFGYTHSLLVAVSRPFSCKKYVMYSSGSGGDCSSNI